MPAIQPYEADINAILAHRHDLGADCWATPDRRLLKGSPFSALQAPLMLLELGLPASNPLLQQAAGLFWDAWRPDGRFQPMPGAIYPCQTISAANLLCQLGCAADSRLEKTFAHLLEIQHTDGGWRCKKFSFGRGPETEFSNPGPTLTALNAFRFTDALNRETALDRAVEFLLAHWVTRAPLGPCHYGIGTRFMQVEYPFGSYNLFVYVHTLSFYAKARQDARFQEALGVLESRLTDGRIAPQRVNRQLTGLEFCKKGAPSEPATRRYMEILRNLGRLPV